MSKRAVIGIVVAVMLFGGLITYGTIVNKPHYNTKFYVYCLTATDPLTDDVDTTWYRFVGHEPLHRLKTHHDEPACIFIRANADQINDIVIDAREVYPERNIELREIRVPLKNQ